MNFGREQNGPRYGVDEAENPAHRTQANQHQNNVNGAATRAAAIAAPLDVRKHADLPPEFTQLREMAEMDDAMEPEDYEYSSDDMEIMGEVMPPKLADKAADNATQWHERPKKFKPETREQAQELNEMVTKVYDEMQEYLENIPCAPQPANMATQLMFHQQQALHWMSEQEKKDALLGGILADDMGVGKTVETIALLCARPVASTLIVCPMTLIHHWKSEIERHAPGIFRIGLYYGTHRPKSLEEMKRYNIMITTYGTLASDYKNIRKTHGIVDDSILGDGNAVVSFHPTSVKCYLYSMNWVRLILDEAQYIKNRYSTTFKACDALSGHFRFALSGTPIQNSLEDLYALLKFTRFPDFPEFGEFRKLIIRPVLDNKSVGYSRLSKLVLRSMLRRRKDQQLRGKKIVDLPPVTNNIINLDFEPGDLLFYQATEKRIMDQFNEMARQGADYVMRHYTHVLVLLLRLRQAACHPYLVAMGHMSEGELGGRTGSWDFDQLESFTQKIIDALKRAHLDIQEKSNQELTEEQILKMVTERVSMGFVINSVGALCVACKKPSESPQITPCKHIHCSTCSNPVQGKCALCQMPYGSAIGKPLKPATPGELYAAANPSAKGDVSAAIDAAALAAATGVDTTDNLEDGAPTKTIKRTASAPPKPKMTFQPGMTLFKNTRSSSTLPTPATPQLPPLKVDLPEIITIDDEDDDVVILLDGPFVAPSAAPSVASIPHPVTTELLHAKMEDSKAIHSPSSEVHALKKETNESVSPPKGALKVTLQPLNSKNRVLSPPVVIAHPMDPPATPAGAVATSPSPSPAPSPSVTPGPSPGLRIGSTRRLLAPETARDTLVMSRARLSDPNMFRPNVSPRTPPPAFSHPVPVKTKIEPTNDSSPIAVDNKPSCTDPPVRIVSPTPLRTSSSSVTSQNPTSHAQYLESLHAARSSSSENSQVENGANPIHPTSSSPSPTSAGSPIHSSSTLESDETRNVPDTHILGSSDEEYDSKAEEVDDVLQPMTLASARAKQSQVQLNIRPNSAVAASSSSSSSSSTATAQAQQIIDDLIPLPRLPKANRNNGDMDLDLSEEESTDEDDYGSDLDDFVIEDDEDELWDLEVRKTREKKRKRVAELKERGKNKKSKLVENEEDDEEELDDKRKVKKAPMVPINEIVPNIGRIVEQTEPSKTAIPLPNFRVAGAAARRAQKTFELKRHSTKLTALLSSLELLKNAGGEDKIVVYSQFVRYMDIIEVPLRNWGWKVLRLDGTLNQAQRAALLQRFDTDPAYRILIVSLKAGGVGINLTVANHIFLMDPWWNTAVEKQAIDRVHRIGQTKPIFVTRFFVNKTVEQRILATQAEKDKVADRALANRRGDAPARAGLSFAELRQLFTSSFNQANDPTDDYSTSAPAFLPANRVPGIPNPAPPNLASRTLSHSQAFAPDPFRPL